jgi:hypothetical protein
MKLIFLFVIVTLNWSPEMNNPITHRHIKAILKDNSSNSEYYKLDWSDSLFPYAQKAQYGNIMIRCYKVERNALHLWWRLDWIYFGFKQACILTDTK